MRHTELNDQIDALIARAQEIYGDASDDEAGLEVGTLDAARQIVSSALRLLQDRATSGDSKLVSSALKELRHAFRVFAPYAHLRKVAVFGSARTLPDAPDWKQAHAFSERMARESWMIITGAGGGIMCAAQGGAGRSASFGVNIRLPREQSANEFIAGDPKLINFRYFFTRKVTFVKEAHAIALFPGGFGTLDEGFEALTLVQTGKSGIVPIVFLDAPGGSYWKEWAAYVESQLGARGMIDETDRSLFLVTDELDEAVAEILRFYRNYHSSRYLGDRLVIRVQRAPDAEELDRLNDEFGDILTRGKIEVRRVLAGERGELAQLPRIVLRFKRTGAGRLRALIDRLNGQGDAPEAPQTASPREIVASELSKAAESEEQAEG